MKVSPAVQPWPFQTRLTQEQNTAKPVAIGYGTNDFPMIHTAGLGIAFHAKPTVQAQADVSINQGGLEQILTFLTA